MGPLVQSFCVHDAGYSCQIILFYRLHIKHTLASKILVVQEEQAKGHLGAGAGPL